MAKLTSIAELRELRSRRQRNNAHSRPRITVCAGTACQASGANSLMRALKRHLIERGLVDRIALRITGCHGFCEMGPFVVTQPQGAFYVKVRGNDVPKIVEGLLEGEYVEELLYRDPGTGAPAYQADEIPFFKKQKRTLLRKNAGLDPIRIFNYLDQRGYAALERTLADLTPEQVIDEVAISKLRGRGGAGFPTATKWKLAAAQPNGGGKLVVCNADEGDPGAYMDRSILEGNPHSVIEGMIIGGYAMGATEGYIFVRHEYPLAIKHSIIALRSARELGLLGENILGTGFSFDIHIVQSAGAFVCGEETALIRTIEGYMGEPRQRPPYPVERGIAGRPTCINNVETWANVPEILLYGGAEYAKVGTANSTGTKVFSVVGKVRNTGLVEVPMGITITDIVYGIGGGPREGARLKAVQIGGPSGGCIPASRFDLPIDYDSLKEAGAMMGSGGMIVMDEDTCMVDVAKYFMSFLRDESCGKCFTCRKGTQRMHEILDDITSGAGTLEQLRLLENLALVVRDTTMCGLGQSAPNPVLSTLRYFRHEYERHIVDKRCDAFVCKSLVGAPCQSACPVGTEAWKYVAHIANGDYEKAYLAIREHNPFPSVCARVCDHKCESRCRLGTTGDSPVAIRALKRFVTDRVDPRVYKPVRSGDKWDERVAIVGAGPAGLTAAHNLSLMGYQVTLIEAGDKPGGMLIYGVPQYRLPRDVCQKEIAALLDDSITVHYNTRLGRDITIDNLFDEGHKAVFLALGAHRSRRLRIDNENVEGVYPSIEFLTAWNIRGEKLSGRRVGVIGGGNSAIDAARVARRQPDVESVTIYYRRTRHEMPAFPDEIEAALEEGIKLEVLASPVGITAADGRLSALTVSKNELGEVDSSGRRRPVEIPGSQRQIMLDTLIVAIGEHLGSSGLDQTEGIAIAKSGALVADQETLRTGRAGVFAGGDAVTGPNTVIDAVAAGQKAALMIHRYLRGEQLEQPAQPRIPSTYVEPKAQATDPGLLARPEAPVIPLGQRTSGFAEVELSLTQEQAQGEALRCLRCDLDFCKPKEKAQAVTPATAADQVVVA